MRYSATAARYAQALHGLASELGKNEKYLNILREVAKAFQNAPEAAKALSSPLISDQEKLAVVTASLQDQVTDEELMSFIKMLVQRGRIQLFEEIVAAFQDQSDQSNGVARGTVESTTALSPDQRTRIEELISRVTRKKAILDYKQTPDRIGGLSAKVGSYTFDDSLDTQLTLLSEYLKRRSN